MNIEQIKIDLAIRVQKIMASRKRPSTDNYLRTWKDKVADTECLVQKVYETLYEILQHNGIELCNNKELDSLISILEPDVNDIIIKNIED